MIMKSFSLHKSKLPGLKNNNYVTNIITKVSDRYMRILGKGIDIIIIVVMIRSVLRRIWNL